MKREIRTHLILAIFICVVVYVVYGLLVGPKNGGIYIIDGKQVFIDEKQFRFLLFLGCFMIAFCIGLLNVMSFWLASLDAKKETLGACLFIVLPLLLAFMGAFEEDGYERGGWFVISVTNLLVSFWSVSRIFTIGAIRETNANDVDHT